LCTYRVGGRAARFVEVADFEQLDRIIEALSALDLKEHGSAGEVHMVGRGSNLLVADRGLPGLVLRLGPAFEELEIPESNRTGRSEDVGEDVEVIVTVGGAASLPVTARKTVAAGLEGFEWAVGVPGSIGGAVRMNAGGHGSEMSTVLVRVRVADLLSGDHEWVDAPDLDLRYRHSSLRPTDLVTCAELSLRRRGIAGTSGDADPESSEISGDSGGEALLKEIVRWRRENQPGGANAGSVFTNPPGRSAGQLIDQAGCKGLRIGSATVSEKHANFIQADTDGSADDVRTLMMEVVRRVEQHSGVRLHPETVMLGFEESWPGADGSSGDQL
ncbi:MAG: UDP-N-acetylmuramate dehydrogenase, partial [Microthrixaceae bacterium]